MSALPHFTIAVASDHAALDARAAVIKQLREAGHEVLDLGPYEAVSCDYPDFAFKVTDEVEAGRAQFGVLLCGSGMGMAMAANKRPKIRAALATNEYLARMSRQHNDANVLCLGARVLGPDLIAAITSAFFNTPFEGGRHQRRVEKFSEPVTTA